MDDIIPFNGFPVPSLRPQRDGDPDVHARGRRPHRDRPGAGGNPPRPKDAPRRASLLGTDYAARFDDFDLAQLAHVIRVCRASDSMADAARKIFAVSLKAKKSSNNTDRLSKYLAKFGLKFRKL